MPKLSENFENVLLKRLFLYGTTVPLTEQNTREVDKKQQQIFDLSMQRAALRQYLRDHSANMTEDQINRILDRINLISKVIEALEKE